MARKRGGSFTATRKTRQDNTCSVKTLQLPCSSLTLVAALRLLIQEDVRTHLDDLVYKAFQAGGPDEPQDTDESTDFDEDEESEPEQPSTKKRKVSFEENIGGEKSQRRVVNKKTMADKGMNPTAQTAGKDKKVRRKSFSERDVTKDTCDCPPGMNHKARKYKKAYKPLVDGAGRELDLAPRDLSYEMTTPPPLPPPPPPPPKSPPRKQQEQQQKKKNRQPPQSVIDEIENTVADSQAMLPSDLLAEL